MNTTGWAVETHVEGKAYQFTPFEEKEVWNDIHAQKICENCAIHGLVHLAFTEQMERKYKTQDDFYKAQKLNGLRSAYAFQSRCKLNEQQAIREVKERAGAETDKAYMDPEKFEKKIVQIEKWIADVEGKKEEVKETPEAPKRRYQRGAKKRVTHDAHTTAHEDPPTT
jgi:hypothetical protein